MSFGATNELQFDRPTNRFSASPTDGIRWRSETPIPARALGELAVAHEVLELAHALAVVGEGVRVARRLEGDERAAERIGHDERGARPAQRMAFPACA